MTKSRLVLPTSAEMDAILAGRALLPTDEAFRFVGEFCATLRDKDGNHLITRKKNLIVDTGFQLIADCLGNSGSRPNVISHIGVGTGTTAAAAGQTALITQVTRVAGTYSYNTKVITFTADFAAGTGTGALTEAGVFNAVSAGIMLNRVVFPVINKGALDTMSVTFTFTLS